MKKVKNYVNGYVSDFKRTKWESKAEIMKSFNVVIIVVVFFAIFFVGGDALITQLFKWLKVSI